MTFWTGGAGGIEAGLGPRAELACRITRADGSVEEGTWASNRLVVG